MAAIRNRCPEAVDLSGETALLELAALGRGARLAVGNDTGPMHLLSAAGCPSAVLFSSDSDPALCGQRGPAVTIIRPDSLHGLSANEVLEGLNL
jgi:ADP-heptose:LPS heptosyltransferase